MRRMHLKKIKKKKIINKIGIIVFLLIISIIYLINVFNNKAIPLLISYSEVEINKIVSLIITTTITNEITNKISMDDLFITINDSNGDIESIDFNSAKVNELLTLASKSVRTNLRYIEIGKMDKLDMYNDTLYGYDSDKLNRGIVYEIPSGIIFNNVLLNNILPKIPVKISPIGSVVCVLNTDIKPYGINNALIEVNINVEAEIKILLPFVSSSTKINTDAPIIMKIIEGNVPSYYMNGYLPSPIVE